MFHQDEKNDRTFLLDTGANRNLIDASVLTTTERSKIDTSTRCEISNFTAGTPRVQSLGTVQIDLGNKQEPIVIQFEVMPERTLNNNLIGIKNILQHFLKVLTSVSAVIMNKEM